MSVEANKALTQRFFDEAINAGNLDLIDELVSADFVEHEGFPGLPTTGPEAPKAALGMFRESFPDLVMSADDLIGEGDKVVVRGTMSGTHTGEFMGIPPTNKRVEVQAMMQQLGLVPDM